MNIGDNIVLTESVLVIDDLGPDFLIAGTEGTVTGTKEGLLSVRTAKGVYDAVPAASVKLKTEGNAA